MTAPQTEAAGAGAAAPASLDRAVIIVGLVVICGQIMAILDTTIVNVALDALSRGLNASLSDTQWVITGYLLALGLVVPLSGWATGKFGTKKVWITALFFFVTGSALCGISTSIGELIAFRVLQGLGGGMMLPLAQTILTRAAGPDRLGRVMALLGVPMLLGPVFGPVLGGVLVQDVNWHWIFYVNVPIGVVAIALAFWKLDAGREEAHGSSFDLPGLALMAAALIMLLYGLSRAASSGSFGSGVLGWLIGGGACLAVFVLYSLIRRDRAVVNVRLFREPMFSASSALIFIVAIALYGGLLLLPLYLQIVRGLGALDAGLLLAPQGLGAMIMTPVSGIITDRKGPGYVIPFGTLLLIVGTLAFTVLHADTSYAYVAGALFVRGLGVGGCMMPVFASAYRRLPRAHLPQASTTISVIMQVGGSFGAAILVLELTRRLSSNFAAHGIALSGGGTSSLSSVPPAQLAHVAPWITDAFGYSFWFVVGALAIGLIPMLVLLPHRKAHADPPSAPLPAAGTGADTRGVPT